LGCHEGFSDFDAVGIKKAPDTFSTFSGTFFANGMTYAKKNFDPLLSAALSRHRQM
jgi:hypothetical protein